MFKTKSAFRFLREFLLFVTQSMMSRRVKQYLSNLTIIQDEEKLRDMSQVCEPAQGSGKLTLLLFSILPPPLPSFPPLDVSPLPSHVISDISQTSINGVKIIVFIFLFSLW